ncbi:MAG: type II toxin-antitoxin system VapC family toxin [Bryobacteraceae bacterium]|jgi:PIN domain nuclease of toxin-antitoxin system
MIVGIADTHAALWHLYDDARLSESARTFFEKSGIERTKIGLSTISLVEVIYLVEKNRLPSSAYDELRKALENSAHVLEEVPFTADIAEAMRSVPREAVSDMPDRIVAATAVSLGVPVISRDGMIRASSVKTIW